MTSKAIPRAASVAVIGAGIVGVATASELSRRGYEVTVYDPFPPGEAGPSRANAGHIGASDIHPLSAPGIHLKALKMLMSRDGALKIPLRDAFAHIPWFWRFWHTSQGKHFQTATAALSYLCEHSLSDTCEIFLSAGISDMIVRSGCAFLYDTQKSFIASKQSWIEKRAAGFDNEVMNSRQIVRDIPNIARHFHHAVLSHQWSMVNEPLEAVRGLAKAAEKNGAVFRCTAVEKLSQSGQSVTLGAKTGKYHHDAAIVAAGVNSVRFARLCGDFLPLVAERGYNLTIPKPGIRQSLPLVFADRGIVATHLASGLRIGGWAEYAHPNRPANQKYFKSIARIAAELFPGLNLHNATPWMGNRPSLPDSVPVISRSPHMPGVFYNCGHGHYGLTHAATSARILAELLSNKPEDERYRQYSIIRFSNTR